MKANTTNLFYVNYALAAMNTQYFDYTTNTYKQINKMPIAKPKKYKKRYK